MKSVLWRVWMERALVATLGLFCCFLALETAFRLLSLFEQHRGECPRPDSGATVVLCLGDSYTDNCGVPPAEAYPPQLEDLLHRSDPGNRYQVLNLGKSGQNSTALLENLESQLMRFQPDIVLVLTGSANYFDLTGYQAFLKADSALEKWKERLGALRVAKLVRLLRRGVESPPPPGRSTAGSSRPAAPETVQACSGGFSSLGTGSP